MSGLQEGNAAAGVSADSPRTAPHTTPRAAGGTSLGAWIPEIVLFLVTFIWGGTFLVTKLALRETGPFTYLVLRFGIGTAAIAAACAPRLRGMTSLELGAGAGIGLTLFAAYAFQTVGLQSIPSSTSAFLTALYVPVVPLLQWGLLAKRPAVLAWAGIAVSFTGLVLFTQGGLGAPMRWSFGLGEWLTIGAAVAVALQIVLVGRYATAADPMRLTVVQLATVAVLACLALPVAGERLPVLTPSLLAEVGALGLFGTAFALAVINWAQRTVPPTRATVIYAMESVWAGVIGVFAGDRMTGVMVAGAALIVAGVVVSELRIGRAWE